MCLLYANKLSTVDISFSSTLNSESGETNSLVLDADSGSVTFSSTVGATDRLSTLAVTGATTLTGNVSTSSTQDFNSAVTLAANTTLDADDANIAVDSTVDGGYTFAVNAGTGTVTMGGALGGSTAINSFAATGNTISLEGNITTADVASNDVTFTGATELTSGLSGQRFYGQFLVK